jgi:hypothetical protein
VELGLADQKPCPRVVEDVAPLVGRQTEVKREESGSDSVCRERRFEELRAVL